MIRKYFRPVIILIFGFSIYACGPKQDTGPVRNPEARETRIQEGAEESWRQEWDKTLTDAKKEGKLIIYGSTDPPVREAWSKHFKDKYGIAIEHVYGRGPDVVEKLFRERKANLMLADLFIGGGTSMYTVLKPAGIFEPFEKELFLPEVIDPKLWFDGRLNWLDAEHTIFISALSPADPLIVNTSLVRQSEIKSFRDLLNPGWKEKIIINDPTIPGSGQQWFHMYGTMGLGNLGVDYMKNLVKQRPVLGRDYRQMAEWVARGKYSIAIAVGWSRFEPFASAGAPVAKNDFEEPDYLSSAGTMLSFIVGRPHPAAARLFANWLLGKEGQLVTSALWQRQSAREDLDYTGVELMSLRRKGARYISAETEESYKKKDLTAKLADEIFGPLLK